jgi:hypothetical protein
MLARRFELRERDRMLFARLHRGQVLGLDLYVRQRGVHDRRGVLQRSLRSRHVRRFEHFM